MTRGLFDDIPAMRRMKIRLYPDSMADDDGVVPRLGGILGGFDYRDPVHAVVNYMPGDDIPEPELLYAAAQTSGNDAAPPGQASPRQQVDDYFTGLGGDLPFVPPKELPDLEIEGMSPPPATPYAPTMQEPGEIQGPDLDALSRQLTEAMANYRPSESGLERAGKYAFETADDFMRTTANIATKGHADEVAAGMNSIFGPDDYQTYLAREREQSELAKNRSPVAAAAGGAAGFYLGREMRKRFK